MTHGAIANRTFLSGPFNLPFWLALAIVAVGYVAAFFVLRLLIPQPEIAGTLAALVLGGGSYVQRALEARLAQPRGPVVTRTGYERPWIAILVGGAALIWLAQSAVPWIQLRGGPNTAVIASIDSLLRIFPPAAAALVGVVAGQRTNRWPVFVAVAAVLTGWVLSLATFRLVIASATDTPLDGLPPGVEPPGFGPPGSGPPPDPVALLFPDQPLLSSLVASQLPLLMSVALIAVWYGMRTRVQAYLGGLVREVEPADREAIVELAYEAARSAQRKAAPDRLAQQRVGEVAPGKPGEDQ